MKNTISQIHGHEVLKLIIDQETPLEMETLLQKIDSSFGKDTQFYTCSEKNLSAPELIKLLMRKGKIIENDGKLSSELSKICSH